ncbi:MAG: DeoR/GlpR transcriptional regulator [Rhodobacteraceae bacterium]|nr:DeoR/GlpR transcriptional regulator [Paracoccaceae bacterium]
MREAYRYAKGARQQRIVDVLTTVPSLRLNELVDALGVSSETIRRDLRELDERGLIARTYGGAVRTFVAEPALAERRRMMTEEREAIAAAVSASIQPDEVLLIGGGATTLHVARRLARDHRRLTIISHSLDIVTALGANPALTIICTPGQYDAREGLLVGHETVAFLRSFGAHRAILGASGVTEEGMSNGEVNAAAVYSAMMACADRATIVADHTKFGVRALKLYGAWSRSVELVSDRAPDPDLADALTQSGAALTLAA